MQVTVNEINDVSRSVIVEVPAEQVDKTFAEVVRTLAKKVNVPGSYTKLPAKIARIKMTMKKEIQKEVANALIEQLADKVIEEQGFDVVGSPIIEGLPPAEEHKPYTFVLGIEVAPKFENLQFEGIEYPEVSPDVSDGDVDAAIEELARRNAKTVDVGQEPIADGFYVKVQASLLDEKAREANKLQEWEEKYFKMNDEAPAALEKALIGFKAGETLSLTASVHDVLHFQDHKHDEEQDAAVERHEWQVKVIEVREWKMPEVDDAFAKEAKGVDTVAALKETLKTELAAKKEQEATRTVNEALKSGLMEMNEFALPRRLVGDLYRNRVEDIRERYSRYAKAYGKEMVEQLIQREEAGALLGVMEEVRTFFLFKELMKKVELSVSEEDVQAWAAKQATLHGVDPSFVLGRITEDQRKDLEAMLLDEKVFDVLKSKGVMISKDAYDAKVAAKREEAMKKYEEARAREAAAEAAADEGDSDAPKPAQDVMPAATSSVEAAAEPTPEEPAAEATPELPSKE